MRLLMSKCHIVGNLMWRLNSLDFATVHNLIKNINLIDSCQAHLLCNMLRTSISFARSDTGVVIDSEPHLFFAHLAVRVPFGI